MIYTVEDCPTVKGKLLVVTPKPGSWNCNTNVEDMLLCIGAKHYRPFNSQRRSAEFVAYTISPAQLRDMETLIDSGWQPNQSIQTGYYDDISDQQWFWHPESPVEYADRMQALALCSLPYRCNRTYEMELAA